MDSLHIVSLRILPLSLPITSLLTDVGPEVLAPICMEKSLWFVVSILGILDGWWDPCAP